MCRKLVFLICFQVVLFGLCGGASAADNHWLGTAGDNKWSNAANWELGHVPDAVLWPTEEAEVGYTTVGAGPILGVGDVGSAYRIFLGQNDGPSMYGELTIDGGTLTTSGYVSTAYHEGTSALITMNSGSVYIGDPAGANGHLYLGRAGPAKLNLNGGTFVADDTIELGRLATGYGEINLAGGTLRASALTLGAGTGRINIAGGTLILNGDATANVGVFIASGLIVGYSGTGTVNAVFENGVTTVTATPEQPLVAPTTFVLSGEKITATASSSNSADEGPGKTIDGSGLDAAGLHSINPTDMWITGVLAAGESAWIQYQFDRPYSLDQMLVWNHNTMDEHLVGFGIKQATVEYSLDGAAWVTLGDVHEFTRATGKADYAANTTIDFGGVIVRYVRITAMSNWEGLISRYGLSEVRFMYVPIWAYAPAPASGATDVEPALTLTWSAGARAVSHDVYLSTNEQSVIDGTAPVASGGEAAYGPVSLDLDRTYYWRVDEVNPAENPAVWAGDLWSFSTKKQLVVDDFESYSDAEGNRIYEIWIDGATNKSGSLVGHPNAPFAEKTIVHGGGQSMPLQYNNAISPFYSEAERTWAAPQDWAAHGADTLTLYFRSDPNSQAAPLYVAIGDNGGIIKTVTHPDGGTASAIGSWREWSIPLSDFSQAGVNVTQVQTLYIGVGDRDNKTAGGAGSVYIDDITLSRAISAAGYSLEFDGIDDYVATPLSDVPVNGTVEAWVKSTNQSRQAVISSYGSSQEFRVHLNYQPGKSGNTPGVLGLNVRFRTLTGYTDIGSQMYDGAWHHVAFVWEGASPGTIRAYWDGQEKPVTYRDHNAWDGNYNRGAVHVIGREDLSNNNYFFTGLIDEVRFWDNKARTAPEIQQYVDKELGGDEEGLKGYWRFNEGQGTTAYDSSPNKSDATVAGAVWTTDAAPVAPAVVPNLALEFDGTDDYVETHLSDVPVNGTVEAWVKSTSQTRQGVFSSHGGDQEFRLHLNYQPGKSGNSPGVLGLNVRFRTLTGYANMGNQMYDGSWHHVAFVWEGASPGTIRAYWDGQETPVTYRDHNAWAGNYNRTVAHVIGREDLANNLYFFTGLVDEVRFWDNKARTTSEIQQYMNKGLAGDEEGLKGYWKFDEGQGTTAHDSSPNKNDATVTGAVWSTDASPVAP